MKIDVTTINGWDTMSEGEQLEALKNYDFDVPTVKSDEEMTKLQRALSKVNSEAAEYKRQLREKQTEQERAEAERAEAERAMRERLEAAERQVAVGEYQSKYLGLGYDADLAKLAAEAYASGDTEKVFEYQAEFNKKQKQLFEEAVLNKQPPLSAGTPPKGNQIDDQFMAAFKAAALNKR